MPNCGVPPNESTVSSPSSTAHSILSSEASGRGLAAFTAALLGIGVFAVGAVCAYLYVMSLQGKQSDRAFALKMNSKKYPRYVRTPPGPMRRLWRGDYLVKSVD